MRAALFLTPDFVATKMEGQMKSFAGGGGSPTAVIFRGEIFLKSFLARASFLSFFFCMHGCLLFMSFFY